DLRGEAHQRHRGHDADFRRAVDARARDRRDRQRGGRPLSLVPRRVVLFGAPTAEPPGSTYHHPQTGAPLKSGPVADIHTAARVSADVTGSFRELALFLQDDTPLPRIGDSTGGSFNLRVEPLGGPHAASPVSLGGAQREPETPMLQACGGAP